MRGSEPNGHPMKLLALWIAMWMLSAAALWILGAMVFGALFIFGMEHAQYRFLTNTTSLVLGAVVGLWLALKMLRSLEAKQATD